MFQRQPLRTDVGAELMARVVDGRLPAGERVNEVHLARDLGVSRTPLREAMLGLQADGVLISTMGRGFQVPRLDGKEICELLTTLEFLEPHALMDSPALAGREVMELQNLLARAHVGKPSAEALAEYLYLMSRQAFGGCANAVLRGLVLRLNRLTLRYAHATLIRQWEPEIWFVMWDAVAEPLRVGDRQRAAAVVAAGRRRQREACASFPDPIR